MGRSFSAKWVFGNTKLEKSSKGKYRVLGFGIPADSDFTVEGKQYNTCPGAKACRAVCYAKQGTYRFRNVINARKHNLAFSLSDTFVRDTVTDLCALVVKSNICRKPYNVVRLHDSGDFYSQKYLNDWATIAGKFPDVTFYAYTKSLHLDLTAIPANLRIVQSLGGKHDKLVRLNRSHSRIFSSHDAREKNGYVDGNIDDIPAIEGVNNIGLVYHGGRNLTPAQKKYFR